ncbi:MAG: hypothetical protein V4583_18665 [Pseudomonadota bacterium]
MATTFERLDDRINMLRPDLNKPETLVAIDIFSLEERGAVLRVVESAVRVAYAQGRKDQHRETAALFRGIMAT